MDGLEEFALLRESQEVGSRSVYKVRLGATREEAGKVGRNQPLWQILSHNPWKPLKNFAQIGTHSPSTQPSLLTSLPIFLCPPTPSHLFSTRIFIKAKVYWEPILRKFPVHIISFPPFSTDEVGVIVPTSSKQTDSSEWFALLETKKKAQPNFLIITLIGLCSLTFCKSLLWGKCLLWGRCL